MKITNSFILSIAGLLSLTGMFLAKGLDTSGSVVTLVLGYVAARQARKASDVIAASRDPSASTLEAIDKLKD
jgi:hypothetical protein